MRRIAVLMATMTLLGGVPVAALAAGSASGVCAQPRLLVLSAFPAEMGKIMKATKLDNSEPIRSAPPASKEFWAGTLETKLVILALSGIGPVVISPSTPPGLLHGDGSTTDPFGGHAAPCLQHGGDLAGCEPCPAALGTSPDPQRFLSGMEGVADPGFFTGLISQGSGSG